MTTLTKITAISTFEAAMKYRRFQKRRIKIDTTDDNPHISYDIHLHTDGCMMQDDGDEVIGNLIKNRKKAVKRAANYGSYYIDVVLNADNSDAQEVSIGCCSTDLSYTCLSQFFAKLSPMDVCKRLANGRIQIIDETAATSKFLTLKDRRAHEKYVKDRDSRGARLAAPPGPGFTLITPSSGKLYWHKPGAVLLKVMQTRFTPSIYILMGQDDNTYFGVELPKPCKTVHDAYKILTPKAALGVFYQRQGEWFAVPCKGSDAPSVGDCFEVDGMASGDGYLVLPRRSFDSNKHHLSASEIRIRKSDGVIFARDGEVTHKQHPTLKFSDWVSFHENTAIRSFSVEGVD